MKQWEYWQKFYGDNNKLLEPSPFAKYCIQFLQNECQNLDQFVLLELGCGNGRDAVFFADHCKVIACDYSEEALKTIQHPNVSTKNVDLTQDNWKDGLAQKYDVCYCRFLLHAIDYKYHTDVLRFMIERGSYFFIECRSNKYQPEEYHFGETHQRWLVDVNEISKILQEYQDISCTIQEANNLAVYGDENPFVIRVVGQHV
jgi:SAM-dependent methyltransferase